jgi:hypothetical protein
MEASFNHPIEYYEELISDFEVIVIKFDDNALDIEEIATDEFKEYIALKREKLIEC